MEIKLSFLGAAGNVTGSRYLLQANGSTLLIDCGLHQERHLRERDWDDFAIAPAKIDAVLLTHSHLDHCGYLPRLVSHGFKGKVFCTTVTGEITRIILMDAARIQAEDAEFKKKRHHKENRKTDKDAMPLYSIEDVQECDPLFSSIPYESATHIIDGVEATFYDAGHILGAASIKLSLKNSQQTRTILFSGDVGRWNRPILHDPTPAHDADYVLVESTYGDRTHEDPKDKNRLLCDVINSTCKAGGNIIIPSFAIERSQEILYHLNQLLKEDCIPNLMVFLDSPMAVRVTEVFEKHPEMFDKEVLDLMKKHESPFDFPGLTMTRTANQSKAINHIKGTVIVIAGSGMCTGGRIKHHLVNNITRKESTILFVGYQAIETLGRTIVEGATEVRILGQNYPVNARIERIHGFSGHADKGELDRWLAGMKKPPKHVFVVHGEETSASHFANHLREKNGWQVSVPRYRDTVTLD
jgi:metallo-beta-lactamase family protein